MAQNGLTLVPLASLQTHVGVCLGFPPVSILVERGVPSQVQNIKHAPEPVPASGDGDGSFSKPCAGSMLIFEGTFYNPWYGTSFAAP